MSELPDSILAGVPLPAGTVSGVAETGDETWSFTLTAGVGVAAAADRLRAGGFTLYDSMPGMVDAETDAFYVQVMDVAGGLMYAVTLKNQ